MAPSCLHSPPDDSHLATHPQQRGFPTMAKRLLPEWHPQDAVQLTWPGPESDWAPLLERIEATLETLVVAIARYQRVLVSVPDTATRTHLVGRFSSLGVPAERLTLVVAESDDTWARSEEHTSELQSRPHLV